MPFLVASAPVRGGRVYALRSRAAVFDAPRTGRSMPTLKRFGRILGESVFILRVQVFGRAPEGKRNDGGKKAVTVEYRPDIVVLISDVMDWGSTLLEHLYFVYKRWESIGSVLAFKRSSSGQFGSPERSEFTAHVASRAQDRHNLQPCTVPLSNYIILFPRSSEEGVVQPSFMHDMYISEFPEGGASLYASTRVLGVQVI